MTLKEVIKRLEADLKRTGNLDVLSFKITDSDSTRSWHRINKDGTKLKLKDFIREVKKDNKNE